MYGMRLEDKMSKYYYPEDRVAIIAMGGLLPDANKIETLWQNILDKKISIREIPERFYNKNIYYKPEFFGKSNKFNKTYTNIAAVPDVLDNTALCRKYKIPPAVAEYMDPNQHATVYCVDQVIQEIKSNITKERTAVILNTSAPGHNFENVVRRTFLQRVESEFLNHPGLKSNPMLHQIEGVFNEMQEKLLEGNLNITEDSTTGYLQNLTAGRISNIFDFQGPSFTVDSACASALTAIAISVSGLLNHEYDLALTGGVEVTLTEVGLVAFSAINALSPDGSYPFDSRANGFVMGLGGGIIALKRLSDAIRDGDQIYSVISGYGQGSDGKGKYIAAPSADGQVRVIKNAVKMAGYSAETIEMIEAHGTGTSVGDVSEITALKNAFSDFGVSRKNYCGVGSIKSNIGHLRNAAGVAGVIKASMALYNKFLPPTANVREVNPNLKIEDSPFYILTEGMNWNEQVSHPRRANVSSFGFGGADYHFCLEEFRGEFVNKSYSFNDKVCEKSDNVRNDSCECQKEALLLSGNTFYEVKESFERFLSFGESETDFGKAAYSNNVKAAAKMKIRVAICASTYDELKEKWSMVCQQMDGNKKMDDGLLLAKGIFIGIEEPVASDTIAFMFPGQASQYPNMLKELYESYPIVKSFYTQVDNIWRANYGYSLMPLIFGDDEDQIFNQLRNTKNTHPAIFLSNMAVYKLLTEAGVKADYMIGHSLGEVTSFYAGEILDLKSAVYMVGERGYCFDEIDQDKRGQMLSVKANKSDVAAIIKENGLHVRIANMNSHVQTIVGGAASEIESFMKLLAQSKITYTLLNVSHAFHTELIKEAAEDFYNKIKDLKFNKPKSKIMACHLKEFYSDIEDKLQDMAGLLKDQITSPVNFIDSIEKLYDEGVRVFIEAGPSNVLTNLAKNILDNKDVKVIPVNFKGKNSSESFKQALAALFAIGVDVSMVPTENMFKTSESICRPKEYACETNSNLLRSVDSITSITNNILSNNDSILYSGVSVGLPGTFKKAFSDDNFDLLFEGTNFIEKLTDEEQNSILDLNVTRLLKTEEVTEFKKISSINEIIKFAGKFGQMDMIEDYLMDEKMLKQTSLAVCAGVAAGYEALKDAGIPLVREYIKTASGSLLPGRLVLPEEMRDNTAIIYANGLFPLDNVITQVSKYTASKFGSEPKMDIINFYSSVISKISDYSSRKLLTDWFNAHYSRLVGKYTEQDIYEFNYNFMTILSSQANNRFAQLIGATGPNLYVNTACSSTASSVSIAEDMLRTGRAGRAIVIGADISSTEAVLPWIGAAFLSIGVLSDSHDLFEAAVPFDDRRNGMILGSGAVGLVIEKETDIEKRGMKGICRILGTHMFNSAGHNSKVDTKRHCIELDRFLLKMESEHGINRADIASKTVYCSHETYSPKNGGCGQMEKRSLEYAFGEKFKDIKVINTKGMTGHTMGASLEEAISAKALQYQNIPPISNYKVEDPDLSGLNLSKGGSYRFQYVLRGVSAFGGNGNYHLLQKVSDGDDRVFDKTIYENWIKRIADSNDAKLSSHGRILVAEAANANYVSKKEDLNSKSINMLGIKEEGYHDSFLESSYRKSLQKSVNNLEESNGSIDNDTLVEHHGCVEEEVLKIYSEITKYPVEMLDTEMELEADLGIDTVKQATIFSMLSERFGLKYDGSIALSNYPTIGHIVRLINSKTEGENKNDKVEGKNTVVSIDSGSGDAILDIISEITMYPKEMLESEMEFEADLGIDTIKQATIFSRVGEMFKIDDPSILNPSRIRTIGSIIQLIESTFGIESEKQSGVNEENKKNYDQLDREDEEQPIADNLERQLCIQVPEVVEENINSKDFEIQKKNVLIIGDNEDTVQKATVFFEKYTDNLHCLNFMYPMDTEDIEKKVKELAWKSIEVIIDLTHIGLNVDVSNLSETDEDKYLTLSSQIRFAFYKSLSEAVKKPEVRIIAAVAMDGSFGFANKSDVIPDPFYGAICGFYKGLGKEWTECKVKVLDIGGFGEKVLDNEALAKIIDEIEACGSSLETGYINNKRVVIKLDNLDRADLKNDLQINDGHFLITGGGNGITAEIIRKLSNEMTGKFTIIGRTSLPSDIDKISKLDASSLEKKKIEIRDALLEKGIKATPLEVQKEYNKILKSISVYTVMNELKSKNCSVLYINCDVRDGDKLKAAIKSAANVHGPVNVVIHAAGVEKSNMLDKKTEEEFNEVFSIKTKGLCNLYRFLDKEQLKVIIGFSSISGRFGNEAQLDYCSANNFITSFMSMVGKENKKVQALSIAWSGWKDIGMAWRNEFVKTNSEELGIHLIEPDRGAHEFINVLTSRINAAEVVISRGLSSFKDFTVIKESTFKTPFIDWITKKDKKVDKVYKVLSVKRDPIIKNHLLGETPLMPAVGFMEICAEFHSLLHGRKNQYCFRDITLTNPLKLHRENSQEISMIPRQLGEEGSYKATFYNYFQPKNMEGRFIELNRMEIYNSSGSYGDLEYLKNIEDGNMKEFTVRDLLAGQANSIKNGIGFGPLFMDDNCKKFNKAKFNDNSIVYSILLSEEQITNKQYNLDNLLINPVFMDSLMQACGIHSAESSGRVHLPWKIQEFGVVNVPRTLGSYRVYGKLLNENDDMKTYDVIMYNENDDVNYYAKGVIVRRINS